MADWKRPMSIEISIGDYRIIPIADESGHALIRITKVTDELTGCEYGTAFSPGYPPERTIDLDRLFRK